MTAFVRPPYQLYEIGAEPHPLNSAHEPGVVLIERDLDGRVLTSHLLAAEQALTLAAGLVEAAGGDPATDRLREALERIDDMCMGEHAFQPDYADVARVAREALGGTEGEAS